MRLRSLRCWALLACLLVPRPAGAQTGPVKEAPVPWHVPQAEVRFPLTPGPGWRAPVDVYLADLRPVDGQGLAFDRATKAARAREVGKDAAGKPVLRVKGEAAFLVRPEYRWLSFHAGGAVRVFAGKAELKPEDGQRFAIPAGTSSIRIAADCDALTEAGFLTAGPKAARAAVCLPGQDPTQVVPLVFTDDGKPVGSVTLWAHPGEPLAVLFDCSAGRSKYFLYPVDRKQDVRRPRWAPEAGIILEARYLDHYDPSVKTLDGFLKLWKQSTFVAGNLDVGEILGGFLPCRPRLADTPNVKAVPRGAPLALARYVGFLRLPADGEYRFHFRAWQGGFLVVDGQTAVELSPADALELLAAPNNAHKIVALKLGAGPHRVEVYQYGQDGQFAVSLGWSSDAHTAPRIVGRDFTLVEAIAPASAGPQQGREAAKPAVSFSWPDRGDPSWRQCLGQWPAEDLVAWQLSAQAAAPAGPVTYRWRFDDGHAAEGPSVLHVFGRTGMRQVTVEAVDAKTGAVLASRTGTVHVQPRWDWPEGHPFAQVAEDIKKRSAEFAAVTPVGELLSLHAWACQSRRADLRAPLGAALVKRMDEVLAKAPADRLLDLGTVLAEPEEQQYAAAEKVLRAAFDRLPPGSHARKAAALGLADVLSGAADKSKEALDLLAGVEAVRPEVDLADGWKIAPDPVYHPDPAGTPLDRLTAKLKWLRPDPKRPVGTTGKMPIRYADRDAAALWLSKAVALAADRPAGPLVLDLGQVGSQAPFGPTATPPGMVWVNGKALGEPWRWREARVVVPAEVVRPGADNQIVLLLQAPTALDFYPKDRTPGYEVLGPGRGEDPTPRLRLARADALVRLGKLEEARKVLLALPAKAWPLEEADRLRVASQLRIARRLAGGPPDDPDNALDQLSALVADYPMLRLDPAVLEARVEAHLGRKEYRRAFLLAAQMLRLDDLPELTRREFLLAQVQASAGMGQLEVARNTYKRLAALSPYSPETVRAREAIIRAAKEH
jgi:hypothetical protein